MAELAERLAQAGGTQFAGAVAPELVLKPDTAAHTVAIAGQKCHEATDLGASRGDVLPVGGFEAEGAMKMEPEPVLPGTERVVARHPKQRQFRHL